MKSDLARLILILLGLSLHACTSATDLQPDAGSSISANLPLGAPVSGVTLSGELAGRQMYLLGGDLNRQGCWHDSEFWDGQTLWFGMSSLSWTKLAATTPAYAADPSCSLPQEHVGTPAFNMYTATFVSGRWNLSRLPISDGSHSVAAPKFSGSRLAYVSYEKTSSALGNIYFSDRSSANIWSSPLPFVYNSAACNDDNPVLYEHGTKLIFESNRTDSSASSCGNSTSQQLWQSSLLAGSWSAPTRLVGAPTSGVQAEQPWLDDNSGKLYWTGDNSICGGGVLSCILTAEPSGSNWSSTATVLVRPTPLISGQANGKVVLVGQFTRSGRYAMAACGIASETDPSGSSPTLFAGRWTVYFSICVIPLS